MANNNNNRRCCLCLPRFNRQPAGPQVVPQDEKRVSLHAREWWEGAQREDIATRKARNNIDDSLRERFEQFIQPPELRKTRPKIRLEERGVSVQFLKDFQRQFDLTKGTRGLVLLHMVRLLTEGTGKSMAELMVGQLDAFGEPYVGKVNLFVSHTVGYVHADTIDAIDNFEQRTQRIEDRKTRTRGTKKGSFYAFVDLFSINQNDLMAGSELPMLQRPIETAGTTLLVCDPWHNPSVVFRVWCCYEAMKTLEFGNKLEVGFSARERKGLLQALRGVHSQYGPAKILDALSTIKVEDAKASKEEDQQFIFEQIKATDGGFRGLNTRLKRELRELMVEVAVEAAEDAKATSMRPDGAGSSTEDAELLYGVGSMLFDVDSVRPALDYLSLALQIQECCQGPGSPVVARCLVKRGECCHRLGMLDESLSSFERGLEIYQQANGKQHISTARCLYLIGRYYRKREDWARSIEYRHRALEVYDAHYGANHIESADTLGGIGRGYLALGEADKALEYAQRELEAQRAHYGDHHMKLVGALQLMGMVHLKQGLKDEALGYYMRKLHIVEEIVGARSSNFGSCCKDIAEFHAEQRQDLPMAIKFVQRGITAYSHTLGAQHETAVELEGKKREWERALAEEVGVAEGQQGRG